MRRRIVKVIKGKDVKYLIQEKSWFLGKWRDGKYLCQEGIGPVKQGAGRLLKSWVAADYILNCLFQNEECLPRKYRGYYIHPVFVMFGESDELVSCMYGYAGENYSGMKGPWDTIEETRKEIDMLNSSEEYREVIITKG